MNQLATSLLDRIVQRLVSGFNPEQIFLFGSYAYGEPNEDSDLDLLVIISQSTQPRYRRASEAYRYLRGISMPTDVIVMTREEVDKKINVRSSLVNRIIHEGIILYGA